MPTRASEIVAKPDGRRQRADGARSRQAILKAATELATVEGLDGLSIARLAEHVGMSKSGLFAHFKSKEELQLATIDAAAEVFEREVTRPGMAAPPGVARVESQCEAFFSYLERGVLQGGCFFVAAAAEFDAKPGPVKDHLRGVYTGLIAALTDVVREAQAMGEIAATEDVDQLTFELDALLLGANFAYVFFDDPVALERARHGVRERLARAAPQGRGVKLSATAGVRRQPSPRRGRRRPPAGAGSR
jgi:AcrR family transcriptional regulator